MLIAHGHTRANRIKYYNNCLFHNVQPNFIVQSGDPTGTGKGGESIFGCARSHGFKKSSYSGLMHLLVLTAYRSPRDIQEAVRRAGSLFSR